MRHYVEIDDRTKTGESILLVLKNLSKTSKSVVFKSLAKLEEELDHAFAKQIEDGLKSENASRSEVMKVLGRK